MTYDPVEDHTEYNGGGVMRNSVFPKEPEALTNGERLRLGYTTGREDNAHSIPRPHQFYGNQEITRQTVQQALLSIQRREDQIRQQESRRYRELPY
jgi:hypothetical protein